MIRRAVIRAGRGCRGRTTQLQNIYLYQKEKANKKPETRNKKDESGSKSSKN